MSLNPVKTQIEGRIKEFAPTTPTPKSTPIPKTYKLSANNIESNQVLVAFLEGTGKNRRSAGDSLTIQKIWDYPILQKEQEHDYIQWLFPSTKPSQFNANAPVITQELREEILNNPAAMANLRKSFFVMLDFFGLKYDEASDTIQETDQYKARVQDWAVVHTHNHQRVTRILECLDNFGFVKEKEAFQRKLVDDIAVNYNLSARTKEYWQNPHQ